MIFYDTIVDNIYDIFDKLPSDIKDNIENYMYELKNHNNNLDDIWKFTKNICQRYTNINLIKDLGINLKVLLEDIKFHSIFTIYLSLKDDNLHGKSIEECVNCYYSNIDKSDDFNKIFNHFKNDFNETFDCPENDFRPWKSYNENYDFFKCLYKNILNHEGNTDEISILIYPEIFYLIIHNFKTSPYINENLNNMYFKRLHAFYEKMEVLIKNPKNILDKTINGYAIERMFKFSFINALGNYIRELNNEKLYKGKFSKQRVKDFTSGKVKDLCYVSAELGDLYCPFDSTYRLSHRYRSNLDSVIGILANIASSPMVFSRNKYIKIIDKIIQDRIEEKYIDIKIKLFFQYINCYIIPLMINVYNYLISYFSNYHRLNKKDLIENYVNENLNEKYNYEEFIIVNKSISLGNKQMKEIFSNNVYKNIYSLDYIYSLTDQFKKSKDIFNDIKVLYEEKVKELINKYTW